jgi:hypothetical protein
MTDISASARVNAIPLEVKKDGLSQKQNGDWILRVVVAAIDMDGRITKAPMGTRYQCVLVEIGDDETPVDYAAKDRDRWRELGPTWQAGIRCNDPIFWAYLSEELHFPPVNDGDMAATCVREHCQVESRSDLSKPGFHQQRERWHKLDYAFQAWRIRENG